jgi:hypothetical protein
MVRRSGARSVWTAIALVLLAGPAADHRRAAAADVESASEYEIKAAYLFNFTRFVTWPAAAFDRVDSPFVICILGADPFGAALDRTIAGETADGHPLRIRRIPSPRDAADCQIVFAAAGRSNGSGDMIAALADRPVLTVGDDEAFALAGGMVAFRFDRQTVRLTVNPPALKRAGLSMSSQVLRLARLVPAEP